jgi:ATP-dependent protease ClpP protease subunit
MRIFNSINKQRPKDNLKELLTVKNETLTSADLYFYGDIVSDWWGAWTDADQYPEAIRDFLKEQEGKNLNIYINSGGGSVFAGIAIYNMLQRHKGLKTVYVDGMAASIASVIALAGDKIIVPSNAFLMVHKPWALCAGNAHDCRKMADDLDAIETGIINVYKDHLAEGADIADIQKMVNEETWLNGEEAAKYFDIELSEPKEYAAKVTDFISANWQNTPEPIIKSAKAVDNKAFANVKAKITRLAIKATLKGV